MNNKVEARAKTIVEKLDDNPELKARATVLALRSKDETLSPFDRVLALAALGRLLEDVEEKPVYKWVNGAKVRVRR